MRPYKIGINSLFDTPSLLPVGVIERSGRLRSSAPFDVCLYSRGLRPALQYLSPNGDSMCLNYGLWYEKSLGPDGGRLRGVLDLKS